MFLCDTIYFIVRYWNEFLIIHADVDVRQMFDFAIKMCDKIFFPLWIAKIICTMTYPDLEFLLKRGGGDCSLS